MGGDRPTPGDAITDPSDPSRALSAPGPHPALAALGDPVAVGILAALSRGERDAHRLVVETGLPQSSIYRKLHEMTEGGLVVVERLAFTPEGRKVELFRSRVREVRAVFVDGRLKVEVVAREDGADRLRSMWDDVRRYGR